MHPERTIILKVRRWGDRLALVLPKEVALQEGLLAEDVLVVKLRKRRAAAPAGAGEPRAGP